MPNGSLQQKNLVRLKTKFCIMDGVCEELVVYLDEVSVIDIPAIQVAVC